MAHAGRSTTSRACTQRRSGRCLRRRRSSSVRSPSTSTMWWVHARCKPFAASPPWIPAFLRHCWVSVVGECALACRPCKMGICGGTWTLSAVCMHCAGRAPGVHDGEEPALHASSAALPARHEQPRQARALASPVLPGLPKHCARSVPECWKKKGGSVGLSDKFLQRRLCTIVHAAKNGQGSLVASSVWVPMLVGGAV